jgi:hypothetical protein
MKPVKSALRLNPGLVHEAEMEAHLHKRTPPKQIEYWAEIGKKISEMISLEDLMAVTQGFAELKVEHNTSYPIDADAVFTRVEEERASGYLAKQVTGAKVCYEADPETPGVLIRINVDGSRDHGHFKNGVFRKLKIKNAR